MATQLVQASSRAEDVKRLFVLNNDAMVKMAPRTTGDPSRLIRIAYNAIAFDSKLVQCTRESLIGGVMEAVKLGITLGGPMQEGWLLPFRNSRENTLDATLIVGYQGYRNIIDRGKSVVDLHPRAVYANDEFEFEFGVHPRIRHRPYWMAGAAEPGPLKCVYAVARLARGGVQVEVMPVKEVEAHRQRSRQKDSGPWKNDYDAMALKTVIRKISKYLPKSSEILARALDLDEKADLGLPQDFDLSGLVVPPETGGEHAKPVAGRLTQLTQQLKGDAPPPDPAGGDDDDLADHDRAVLEQDRREGRA